MTGTPAQDTTADATPEPLAAGRIPQHRRPRLALVNDRLLGGSCHERPDRAFADQLRARAPRWPDRLRTAHEITLRALRLLVHSGIDQVIDLSGAVPGALAPHRVLDVVGGRLVQLHPDPLVADVARRALAGSAHRVVQADPGAAGAALRAVREAGVLDLRRPVALLATTGTLERWESAHALAAALGEWGAWLPPGSPLLFTHDTDDDPDTDRDADHDAMVARAMHHRLGVSLTARSAGEITGILDRAWWRLHRPLTYAHQWPAHEALDTPASAGPRVPLLVGIASYRPSARTAAHPPGEGSPLPVRRPGGTPYHLRLAHPFTRRRNR